MESKAKPNGTATLNYNDQSYDLPVFSGEIGPDVIDIRKLYAQTGAFTYDPGFTSTASCESQITYIDGDQGTLLYRGYPIDQLADRCLLDSLPLSVRLAPQASGPRVLWLAGQPAKGCLG